MRINTRGDSPMWRTSLRLLLRRKRDRRLALIAQQTMPTLTVASYNIHRCIGTDKKLDPQRVREVIASLNADIIALQEVDNGIHTNGDESQFAFIRRHFPDYHFIEGPTITDERGHYGNVLMSKLPVVKQQIIDLAVAKREPRGAIAAQVMWQGQPFWIIGVHLGLRSFERKLQYRTLNELMRQSAEPVIMCGDFNEWKRYPRSFNHLEVNIRQLKPHKSFPSRFPVFPLDRVFCHPEQALAGFKVVRTPGSRVASDHLPVIARIHMDELLRVAERSA